jgi:peroxiredoxin
MKFKCLIIALLPFFAAAQNSSFTITGKIGNLNKPAKIHLDYRSGGVDHTDSVTLINGIFNFSGHVDDIASARITLDHTGEGKQAAIFKGGDNIYPYFGNENITITSNDSLINASVAGSKVYDEQLTFYNATGGSIMEITRIANARFSGGSPEEQSDTNFVKAINVWYQNKIMDHMAAQIQFAKNNPHSFFAIVALMESAGLKLNVAQVEPIYNEIDEKWRMTGFGKDLAKRIQAARTAAVGDLAPVFTLNDVNGKPVSLADLKGKIVLIDFWASWCEPCRAEGPNLKEQYRLYKDKGFEIFSVSLDTDRKNWLKAIKDDGLTWIQVADLKGYQSDVVKSYGLGGVPSFFLIGRDGKIIADTDIQGAALNKRLAEIFKN